MYRSEKGKWKEQEEMIEGWDELVKKMKTLDHDISFHDFMETYFAAEKHTALRRHAIDFAQGFDLADSKKASTLALYKEWSRATEENFRIPAGYGALVNFVLQQNIAAGCRVIYNEKVKQIHWKKNSVIIQTAANKKYTGTKVFITLPVSILQGKSPPCSITFAPALLQQMEAASQIGFGEVIKIILLFKEPFWKKDSGFIFSDEIIPTWWTQLPNKVPVLTGWAGGAKAATLSDKSKKTILQRALESLSNIYEIPLEELVTNLQSSSVANWQKNGSTAGAYSYATTQTKAARKLMNEPVEDTIYFCGEAIYDGEAPGTVEASIAHALQTAKKIQRES